MGQFVKPETYLIGYTGLDKKGLYDYLHATGNEDFIQSILAAEAKGISEGEIACSFYAKLCYNALTLGHNANVTRVRDIPGNIKNAFEQGHGSVFEHAWLNFVTTNCSRVFTHELVRHRAGTAFSQTSGRYVRLDKVDVVFDPILEGCEKIAKDFLQVVEEAIYLIECQKGLRVPNPKQLDAAATDYLYNKQCQRFEDAEAVKWIPNDSLSFDVKKKLTSAIRRFAPNGQSNEIGWSVNLRAIRHIIQMRTAKGAEWEIRLVFNQVYELLKEKFPLLFFDANETMVDGLLVISGMRSQPYEERAA
jgi:thymidylate synthase (FAD)